MTRASEDPLVAKAFDGKQHEELARAVAQLSPEEAAFFLHRLEAALRKRKIQLGGYLLAMVSWLVGMVLALLYYSLSDSSALWAFIVPFGIVGLVLYGFGAWAERVGKTGIPSAIATSVPRRTPANEATDEGMNEGANEGANEGVNEVTNAPASDAAAAAEPGAATADPPSGER